MGQVHDLLGVRGKLEALKAAEFDRREIEAAAAYMSDEDSGIGFLYSGWCQAALPHKRLPDNKGWQIKTDRVTLIVEPGMRPGLGEEPEHIGVPFGSRARLIMLYLQSEALRTRSREVELGKSLRGWLLRMGISVGGKSVDAVREQAERISRCRLLIPSPLGQERRDDPAEHFRQGLLPARRRRPPRNFVFGNSKAFGSFFRAASAPPRTSRRSRDPSREQQFHGPRSLCVARLQAT